MEKLIENPVVQKKDSWKHFMRKAIKKKIILNKMKHSLLCPAGQALGDLGVNGKLSVSEAGEMVAHGPTSSYYFWIGG